MHRLSLLVIPLLLLLSLHAKADEGTRLLRFPDIQGERIAFVYAGDIYVVSADGGVAQRLTSHEGMELYPKFSPDGRWIAFSAEYSGTRQVYVMPASGGEPRQLTWYNDIGPMPPRGGTDYRVLDWTPDGQHIVVRANRLGFDERAAQPWLVPFEGGMERPLQIPETGGGMLSADGRYWVYTPIDREFRTWKRHRGGRAQNVWIYDLQQDSSLQLTDFVGTDNQPMWVNERVWFTSDRSGTLNLYSISPEGGEPQQVTEFDGFDVLWPSSDRQRIVFEKGGWLWRHDPASGETRRLSIHVRGDKPHRLPRFVNVAGQIESFDIAPKGERAVFAARGELFSVPAKHGEIRNLSRTPAAREISVSWSPDESRLVYLSDASGEYQIYVRGHEQGSESRMFSTGPGTWLFAPQWSPDNRHLAFADSERRLRLLDTETGRIDEVDQTTHITVNYSHITQFTFSPDGKWLAYVKANDSYNTSIWVYSLADKRSRQLTPDTTSEFSPAFDPKGRYLYFASNRDWNLSFSAYEFNYLYTNATRLYAATLAADGPPLLRPRSDEVGVASSTVQPEAPAGRSGSRVAASSLPAVTLDVEGFNERVVALKHDAGNYQGLQAIEAGLFFMASGGPGVAAELMFYSLEEESAESVLRPAAGYRVSADGNKLLVRRGNNFAIVDAKPGQDFNKGALDLGRLELRLEPTVEWQQMYVDGWRILRDWFYDPGTHGQDWPAIRERYEPLLQHVAHRADLDYIFGEIAGELNAGHVYVNSGDQPTVERKPGGLLGAEIEAHDSGYFRIAKIFPGENWHEAFRSPLREPGVEVSEGDYILAVDGRDSREVRNFYQLLENRGDRVVRLRVNNRPTPNGSREIDVRTVTAETNLRYLQWVAERRDMVDRLSGGRIGYIHLPNTAMEGNRELFKGMLAYARKDALIIDDRYNGGGFIPDRMIEWLSRTPLNYWVWRGFEPQPRPLLMHEGPKAMLINGQSSSGGDALPYYFRKLNLGTIIGTRTWGGLIGISGNPGLADGGSLLAATFRFLDTDGAWAVEDEGVSPDIEVIDRPELVAAGRDPSVEKAVEVLLEELQRNPPRRVRAPPAPSDFSFE